MPVAGSVIAIFGRPHSLILVNGSSVLIVTIVRHGVILGCALDFPRPLGGLRSLGEGWWRSLGSVSAGEALGT